MKWIDPELMIPPRQVREQYLRSYGLSEIYRLLYLGRIRAAYEQRKNRRKWSIPVSAILEFQQTLIPNIDQQERGVPAASHLERIRHPYRAPRVIQGGLR